jgi:hypothetical protein
MRRGKGAIVKAKYQIANLSPIVERPSAILPMDYEAAGSHSDQIPLPQYFASLRRHWPKILAVCAGCVLAAFIISKRISPVYESTASLEIDRQNPAA